MKKSIILFYLFINSSAFSQIDKNIFFIGANAGVYHETYELYGLYPSTGATTSWSVTSYNMGLSLHYALTKKLMFSIGSGLYFNKINDPSFGGDLDIKPSLLVNTSVRYLKEITPNTYFLLQLISSRQVREERFTGIGQTNYNDNWMRFFEVGTELGVSHFLHPRFAVELNINFLAWTSLLQRQYDYSGDGTLLSSLEIKRSVFSLSLLQKPVSLGILFRLNK